MGFMGHVCAELLLAVPGAADPISSIEKVKSVDSLNTNLVALVGFGVCRNASSKSKERRFIMGYLLSFCGISHAIC